MISAFIKSNIWLFALCLLISSLYIDWSLGWNTVSRVAMPLNLALRGDISITPYAEFTGDKAIINGIYYSDKAPLPGLLLLPVFYLVNLFGNLNQLVIKEQLELAVGLGGFFLGALPFCLSIIKVKKMLNHIMPVWVILLFFFSSFLFAFAGTAFSHCLAGLFLLLSFDAFRQERALQCGLWLGAAFCTEYSIAVFGFIWAAYFIINKQYRAVIWLLIGSMPFLAFQASYNYFLTNSPFDFTYKFQENFAMNAENYGFKPWPSLSALWHITISSYRGLFFYAPVLIPLLVNKNFTKGSFWRSAMGFTLFSCLLYTLLFSMSKSWYMGWTFGPRYLYSATLLLFCIFGFSFKCYDLKTWKMLSIIMLGALSFLHVWFAKVIYPYPPAEILFPAKTFLYPKFMEGNFYPYHLFKLLDLPSFAAATFVLITVPVLIVWSRQVHPKLQ